VEVVDLIKQAAGGAGGYRTSFPGGTKLTLSGGTSFPITVGAGGTAAPATPVKGSSGSNSVFSTITSVQVEVEEEVHHLTLVHLEDQEVEDQEVEDLQ
jgi:hypothetical protein